MESPAQQFKILLIGDSGVGKSSIIHRFTSDAFTGQFLPTIGIDYRNKVLDVPNNNNSGTHPVRLCIWDSAGQERFRSITKAYFRGSHGMLLVYDSTDRTTFDNCSRWMECVRETHDNGNMVVYLVANKSDLKPSVVLEEEGESLALEYGVHFVSTSAKCDVGIHDLFLSLAVEMETRLLRRNSSNSARRLLSTDPVVVPGSTTSTVKLSAAPPSKKTSCC